MGSWSTLCSKVPTSALPTSFGGAAISQIVPLPVIIAGFERSGLALQKYSSGFDAGEQFIRPAKWSWSKSVWFSTGFPSSTTCIAWTCTSLPTLVLTAPWCTSLVSKESFCRYEYAVIKWLKDFGLNGPFGRYSFCSRQPSTCCDRSCLCCQKADSH